MGLNTGRWLLGGVVAGIVIWICEGIAAMTYMDEMDSVGLMDGMDEVGVFVGILVYLESS